MKKETIIRAWRDPEFRESLTAEERAALPECPAGQSVTELDEGELARAVGGASLAFQIDSVDCMCTRFTAPKTTTFTINQGTIRETSIIQVKQLSVLGR